MDSLPTPLISTGRIKGSLEIFTYLARIGDQNSFVCPFIRSMFVDHLVNVRHYPPGVALHRGKQTSESVILMPEWGNTEGQQGTVGGTHPSLGERLSFFCQLQSPASSPGPCTSATMHWWLWGPGSQGTRASLAAVYQSQMVLLINLVSP